MVACLSCTLPDALPGRSPRLRNSSSRFNSIDAIALLNQCKDLKNFKQIHAKIIKNGLLDDQSVVTKLLHTCSSYGKMDYATLVFRQIQNPTTFTWNLMIRAHTINKNSRQALLMYNLLISHGKNPPDKFTFPFVIKACLDLCVIEKVKEVHLLAIKTGFCEDVYFQNTLLDFYYKCGDIGHARKVFNKMHARNVVSWTTMISGLVSSGQLDAAQVVFEEMPMRNVVSWTVMIDGLARTARPLEAFELFWRMQFDGLRPNEFTLVSLLIGCTELGSVKLGRWVHDFALKNRFDIGVFLGTALIDMYSKCGSLEDAKRVFDNMEVRSLATWNSMITSLGVHGRGEEALDLFAKMEMAGVQPDAITFVGVLSACARSNNVAIGLRLFESMRSYYGIDPIDEHYTCMINLSNRAKMLLEVRELVDTIAV
ncbi:hypothetical protein RJ639_044375 [Escallonia herrerae]|uniref:Pentatricopeptide repeat-containing protein n=1 Tax=Escallonia herrerae TaxID=1293975 RepID=A0AA88WGF8_9ASTE|nr:hypothetical protein RJ639_044375 [Escallonia herrerae]